MLDLIRAYENYLTKVKQASGNTVASYMRDIRQFSEWLRDDQGLDVVEAEQVNIGRYLTHLESEGPKCGEPVMPHRACKACGNYNGRQVVAAKAE